MAVNVKTFGAVGDGVTDDTAAIQAALNSNGGNPGEVDFPAGVYLCNQTTNASWSPWPAQTHVFTTSSNTLVLQGLDTNGNPQVGAGTPGLVTIVTTKATALFDINGSTTVNNITFQYKGGYFLSPGFGFGFLARANLVIRYCIFIDWLNSVLMGYGTPVVASLQCWYTTFKYLTGYANPDATFGWPSPAILGGGTNTQIYNNFLDGRNAGPANAVANPNNPAQNRPADGLIKTNNYVNSLTAKNNDVLFHGIEGINCDSCAANDLENNAYIPFGVFGGQCSIAVSFYQGATLLTTSKIVVNPPNSLTGSLGVSGLVNPKFILRPLSSKFL